MRFTLFALLSFVLIGCSAPTDGTAETTESQTEAVADVQQDPAGKVFGAEEDFSEPIDYSTLVNRLAEAPTDTMVLTVQGTVNEVCQAKGCWMTIAGDDEVMVKFKDYGFFMPKDISGQEVVMHGKAYYQTTPIDELRHYAEDAGKSAEEIAAITEPKRELHFLASGVLLLD